MTVEDAKKLKPKKVKEPKNPDAPKAARERSPLQVAMSETAAATKDYADAAAAVTKYGQKLAEATKERDLAQKRMLAAREAFTKLTGGAPVALETSPGVYEIPGMDKHPIGGK